MKKMMLYLCHDVKVFCLCLVQDVLRPDEIRGGAVSSCTLVEESDGGLHWKI